MLAPERRTRTDIAVALAIVLALAVFVGVTWWHSDARTTTSQPASSTIIAPPSATSVPKSLTEAWRAPSTATPAALTVNGAVITANGGSVTGHDRLDGHELWRYSRQASLCHVIGAWDSTLAVYRDSRGCGQAIVLNGENGARDVTRNSAADADVALSTDGTYVVSRGNTRMELWRSDLVRTLEYGRVEDQNQPNSQPRTGCALISAVSSSSRLAVVEDCPDDPGLRLSILEPAPKDAQKPEDIATSLIDRVSAENATVSLVAAGMNRFAAYISEPGKPARIAYFDAHANADGETLLPALPVAPAGFTTAPIVARNGSIVTVWAGSEVVALDTIDLTVRWVRPQALGPGAMMADRLLVPVSGGIAVLDPHTGKQSQLIRVDRDSTVPVTTAIAGDVIVEQRGTEVVALR